MPPSEPGVNSGMGRQTQQLFSLSAEGDGVVACRAAAVATWGVCFSNAHCAEEGPETG